MPSFFTWMGYSPGDEQDLTPMLHDLIENEVEQYFSVTQNDGIEIKVRKDPWGIGEIAASWFFNNVKDTAKRYGWFVLMSPRIDPDRAKRFNRAIWTLSPYYTVRIEDMPTELYHVTQAGNVVNIMNRGIIPRSGRDVEGHTQRNYPDRVYLATDIETAEKLMMGFDSSAIADAMATGGTVQSEYIVLKIDVSKLTKGTKLYRDPEMKSGSVWTYTPIPGEAISVHPDYVKAYEEFKSAALGESDRTTSTPASQDESSPEA